MKFDLITVTYSGLLLYFVIMMMVFFQYIEPFQNHMIESVPVDIQLSPSQNTTYFYEKNNTDFEGAMNAIFGITTSIDVSGDGFIDVNPIIKTDETIVQSYNTLLTFVSTSIASNTHLLENPGTDEVLNIVQDRLIRYKPSNININTNTEQSTFLDIELVLFRYGAFEGKHAFIRGSVDSNNVPKVLAFKILGAVFADKIYMRDVTGYDISETEFQQLT